MNSAIWSSFDKEWEKSLGLIKKVIDQQSSEMADIFALEAAKILAPFKFKKGRLFLFSYLNGSIFLNLGNGVLVSKHAYQNRLKRCRGGYDQWKSHKFPFQEALRVILAKLEELNNDEEDCLLFALDGVMIPLTLNDL